MVCAWRILPFHGNFFLTLAIARHGTIEERRYIDLCKLTKSIHTYIPYMYIPYQAIIVYLTYLYHSVLNNYIQISDRSAIEFTLGIVIVKALYAYKPMRQYTNQFTDVTIKRNNILASTPIRQMRRLPDSATKNIIAFCGYNGGMSDHNTPIIHGKNRNSFATAFPLIDWSKHTLIWCIRSSSRNVKSIFRHFTTATYSLSQRVPEII